MSNLQIYTELQDEVHSLLDKAKILKENRWPRYKEISLYLEKVSTYIQEVITEEIQYQGPKPTEGEEAEDG